MSQREVLQATPGVAILRALGFIAVTVLVDNFTDSFMWIPDAGRFVEPQCTRCVLPLDGTQVAAIQWLAPPGQTQPTAKSTQQATVIFSEEEFAPGPGMLGLRSSYYDRGGLPISLYYSNTIGPHAPNNRFTYTVPANRSAFLEQCLLITRIATVATVPALKASTLIYTPVSTLVAAQFLIAPILPTDPNVAGASAEQVIGASVEMKAADLLQGQTTDASTGGTIYYQLSAKLTEFDA